MIHRYVNVKVLITSGCATENRCPLRTYSVASKSDLLSVN